MNCLETFYVDPLNAITDRNQKQFIITSVSNINNNTKMRLDLRPSFLQQSFPVYEEQCNGGNGSERKYRLQNFLRTSQE